MTLGPVMLDVQGVELQPVEKEILAHPAVGGVILFSRNYESPDQLIALCQAIHAVRTPPLLISVDQEGGRVQRFRSQFTQLPAAGLVAKSKDALQMAEQSGWLMATEVIAGGVDLSFAPVLDLDYGVSSVIGDRAFHRQPSKVAELALAYQRGMHHAGMATVGKHFPGHGAVVADSHAQLPEDERDYADLEKEDLIPFERLIVNGLNGIMAAHVLYPAIDSQPAGFSRFWLQETLRQRMNFQGVIFSDDLSMGGAEWAGGYTDRADRSLDAGCDMILVCNKPEQAVAVVEHLENYRNPASAMRLARLHSQCKIDWQQLCSNAQWQSAVSNIKTCNVEPWLDMDME